MSDRSSMFGDRLFQVPTLLDRLGLRNVFVPGASVTALAHDAPPDGGAFELIDRRKFVDALVAIFAPDTAETQRMKVQIEEVGGTVMLISQPDLPETWLAQYAARLSCCIVGHDFADFQAASEFCLTLRRITPDLAIVLTLPGSAPHDFSPALQPVCDARLRRPVSRTPLLLGIQAARDNRTAHLATDGPARVAGWDRRSQVGCHILA